MNNTETVNVYTSDTTIENIYINYYNSMYQKALKILNNHEDAEDVVQYAFVTIVEMASKFEGISAPKVKNLVFRIVQNKAIDIYRHKARSNLTYANDCQLPHQKNLDYFCLSYYLEKLPDKYKQALIMKFIHGYTNKEAAYMLNISEENFRKRVFRGKQHLRSICDKEKFT